MGLQTKMNLYGKNKIMLNIEFFIFDLILLFKFNKI